MASLLIRNVDDALHTRLKARALAHHRSLQEEVRETLRSAIARTETGGSGESLVALATRIFGPENGFELDLPPRTWPISTDRRLISPGRSTIADPARHQCHLRVDESAH